MPTINHDELIRRLRTAVAATDPVAVGDAFAASLSSAPLIYRSSLRSWACASLLPDHEYVDLQDNHGCGVCGVGREVDGSTEELLIGKQSGTCSGYPDMFAALVDLEHFQSLPPVAPSPEDGGKLHEILTTATGLAPGARATHLIKALRTVVVGNRYDREAIAETLAACGVLNVQDHPAPATRWVGEWEQNEMPNTKTDLDNPLAWWCVEEGLGSAAISRFFPRLEMSLPDEISVRRSISPQPVRLTGIRGVRSAMTLEPGDLLAIEYDLRVFTGLVLGSHGRGKKRLPVMEFFSHIHDDVPDAPLVLSGPMRMVGPFGSGERWRREPLAVDGLQLFGKVWEGKLLRLAQGCVLAPHHAPVVEVGFRVIQDRNLLYVLKMLATESLMGGGGC